MIDIYTIIRIPKSGSTSLENSISNSLSPTRMFKIPMLNNPDMHVSQYEKFRTDKKMRRSLWKIFRVLSEEAMWDKIRSEMSAGDIISGHIEYGRPHLDQVNMKYITIIRNPLDRFISEYKWIRHGYQKRRMIQKLAHFGRPAAAGKSMDYYLDFLIDHEDAYKNPTTRYVTGNASHTDPHKHLVTNYWHYGILEKTDVFAKGFTEKTGLPFELEYTNLSPTPSKIALTTVQTDKFERLHTTDLALYHQLSENLAVSA